MIVHQKAYTTPTLQELGRVSAVTMAGCVTNADGSFAVDSAHAKGTDDVWDSMCS